MSYIAHSWRRQPLTSHQAILADRRDHLNGGLTVYAQLDERSDQRGVSLRRQAAAVNITKNEFHGEWNWVIKRHGC